MSRTQVVVPCDCAQVGNRSIGIGLRDEQPHCCIQNYARPTGQAQNNKRQAHIGNINREGVGQTPRHTRRVVPFPTAA